MIFVVFNNTDSILCGILYCVQILMYEKHFNSKLFEKYCKFALLQKI